MKFYEKTKMSERKWTEKKKTDFPILLNFVLIFKRNIKIVQEPQNKRCQINRLHKDELFFHNKQRATIKRTDFVGSA